MAKRKQPPFSRPMSQKIQKVKQTQRYRWMMLFGLFVLSFVIYFVFTSEKPYVAHYHSDQNEEGFYMYSFVPSKDYYYSANYLTGDLLKTELNRIISANVSSQAFDDSKSILTKSDLSLEDSSKIVNIFDGALIDSNWDDEITWMRTHVWPNSRLGVSPIMDYQRNIASDLHNIRAITPAINQLFDQRFFSDGSGVFQQTDDGGFYPGDEHKGDVARILFYMAIRYPYLILSDEDLVVDESNEYTMDGIIMGKLSLLLEWHKEDPVDDFERQRNKVIYHYQNNRNPFIDKPEYAHLIWENKTIDELKAPNANQVISSLIHHIKKMNQSTFIYYKQDNDFVIQ